MPRCFYRHPCPIHPSGWRRVALRSKAERGYGTGAWNPLRRIVLARDGGVCQTCGEVGTIVDHIHPKSLGGSDELDNLALICARCHRRKTARHA
jgi:5-methylcytosine-specific restriction protein A